MNLVKQNIQFLKIDPKEESVCLFPYEYILDIYDIDNMGGSLF